ncbi:MAG: hypothetical protein WD003_00695 [Candidatus Paceibacterota bacterium]
MVAKTRSERRKESQKHLCEIEKLATPGATFEDVLEGDVANVALYKKESVFQGKCEPPCVLLVGSNGKELWIKQFAGSCNIGGLVGYKNAVPLECFQGERCELTGRQRAVLTKINIARKAPYHFRAA